MRCSARLLLLFSLLSFSAQATTIPKELRFCVATAAHQIEGGNTHSDWWAFEQIPGSIKHGDTSAVADDHWNRVNEDAGLIQDLGATVYRFSVEWARIEPIQGQYDPSALEHYRQEIAELKKRNIIPMVTLQHFTLPQWVAEKGGWDWDGIPDSFKAYTKVVSEALGDSVQEWVTLNEPMVLLSNGYVFGIFPPKKSDITKLEKPFVNMVRAHAKSYHVLHDEAAKRSQTVRVGIAHHLRIFDPLNAINPLDHLMAWLLARLFNWSFMEATDTGRLHAGMPLTFTIDVTIPEAKGTQDFIGLNYYSRDMIEFALSEPTKIRRHVKEGAPVNDLGWEIYPEGMGRLLREIHDRYPKLPISITENGIADAHDTQRGKFLTDHMREIVKAMESGIDINAYCHWSLMDNFEWLEGYEPRFGLYDVDYKEGQRRVLRPSGELFRTMALKREWP